MKKTCFILVLLLLFAAAAFPAANNPGESSREKEKNQSPAQTNPEQIIEEEIRAYNARDLDAFLKTYSGDIKIYRHPDTLLYSGKKEMSAYYRELFQKAPRLHAEIVKRIVQGDYVIDQERVTGHIKGPLLNAVLIYKIKDGLIHRVWIISQ